MRTMKTFLSWTLLSLMVVAMVACGDDAKPANLRAVHASADAPNVDVAIDGTVAVTDLAFQESTGYLEVESGQRNIQVRPTGTTTAVITASPTLDEEGDYTLIAVGPVASIEPLLLTDDNAAPGAGNVKVRLVHGSPTAGPVDIYVTAADADLNTTDPTVSNVPFKGVSNYLEVAAGTYRVRITPTGTKTVAIDATLTLAAGQIRTAIAVDAPGGGVQLGAIVLEDLN